MLDTCVFEFDRPDPVYYSSETISGRIKLKTTRDQAIRAIFIDFLGEAAVCWEERKTRQADGFYYIEEYSASETYLQTRSLAAGESILLAGNHVYPFSIALPLQCPTSCIEIYGHITYVLSLLIHRTPGMNNSFKQPLMVLRQLNLNLYSEYWLPMKNEDIKYFCCWPCTSSPVISTFSTTISAYAPGQQIKYMLEIDNQTTDIDLNGITIELIQTYTFIARHPNYKVLNHSNVLAQTQQHDRYLRLTKRIIDGTLTIPPVPPSSLNSSGILTVHYTLKVSIKTGLFHKDSIIVLPIIIGTVPLTPIATIATNQENISLRPWTYMPENNSSSAKPPGYDNYLPPSFEEATAGTSPSTSNANANESFILKYPVYTNITPTAPPLDYIDASAV